MDSKSFTLTVLPLDVLECIVSRVSCEISLLGGIAKVNREFRAISLEKGARESVRKNFIREHPLRCFDCFNCDAEHQMMFFTATYEGRLPCVMWASYVSPGPLPERQLTYRAACAAVGPSFVYDDGAVDVQPTWGSMRETALHLAAGGGHLDMIRYFVEEKGASDLIDTLNNQGETVLHRATEGGHVHVIRYFVEEMGAEELIPKVDNAGNTVLHTAASGGHLLAIKYFVEQRGAVGLLNVLNNDGNTVLHPAAGRGHLDVLKYFLEESRAANLLCSANSSGDTVLHAASYSSHVHVLRYLLESGAARDMVYRASNNGGTVLHSAVRGRSMDTVKFFVDELGLTDLISRRNNFGCTVLHFAASMGLSNILCYLAEKTSPDVLSCQNLYGNTALGMARDMMMEEAGKALQTRMQL